MKRTSSLRLNLTMLLMAAMLAASPAFASGLCENPSTASDDINDMNKDIATDIKHLVDQEEYYIDLKLMSTAKQELNARFDEFGKNMAAGFAEFKQRYIVKQNSSGTAEKMKTPMQLMAAQLSQAKVEQTQHIGAMMDAEMTNETKLRLEQQRVKASAEITPNEASCQVDSAFRYQAANENMSKALARSYTQDNQPRTLNSKPATVPSLTGFNKFQQDLAAAGAGGPGAEQPLLWTEYQTYFCDKDNGDQGCENITQPTTELRGQDTDLPRLLWGGKQSQSVSSDNDRRVRAAVLRNLISPRVPDIVPADIVNLSEGIRALLQRRAQTARYNAVYMAVGQMLAERANGVYATGPGSQLPSTAEIRTASGVADDDASLTPSYREIQEAMARNRAVNPNFIAKMVGSPNEVVGNQAGVNAVRLQATNDIYKRYEEMVVTEAASYAAQLDREIPGNGITKQKIRK